MIHESEQPGAHVEVVLSQIGSLPTLSPIAVRVMRAANSGDADLREIARLIESDASMTAKVLALCRRADMGVSHAITTVDRAVVMLGLEAVRAAVLSVEIHEMFSHALERSEATRGRRADDAPAERAFDRKDLWRHSVAVASAAELIAEGNPAAMAGYSPQEAFLAGLLHDLGKLALDAILPRSFERVAVIARDRRMNIAEVERRVLGLDHHLAGKRLGEHWGLPHALQDVMWLHGQSSAMLPEVPHRVLIGVVTTADAAARRLHLGWSGNAAPIDDLDSLCRDFGFDARRVGEIDRVLIDRVSQRCVDIGLDHVTPASLMLDCLSRANGQLGQVSAILDARARDSGRAEVVLRHVTKFLAGDSERRSFASALSEVGRHAAGVLGSPSVAVVVEAREGSSWSLDEFDAMGAVGSHRVLEPPREFGSLRVLFESGARRVLSGSVAAWLTEQVNFASGSREARLVPLIGASGGLTAVLLHSGSAAETMLGAPGLEALAATWGVALSSASKHEGAKRLGEQLAEANRALSEAQSRLVSQKSMERLAEFTAGAAHEMNNPLMVISGMAQVLSEPGRAHEKLTAAAKIIEASEKLSELITNLHLFAEPPRPARTVGGVAELLNKAAGLARERAGVLGVGGRSKSPPKINLSCDPGIGAAYLDHQQIALALCELIVNGLLSSPKRGVDVRASVDGFDGGLVISVTDDGCGMSARALDHAFDPFFSELPAGRRAGLGLPRARRYVDLHRGEVMLESTPGKGTTARIILPDWRDSHSRQIANQAA
ncbi:MAG: HDOD domain-containing protein [Phycisphaerae bacterium]|nr:HDOD domain-containing protein [Phycisphaerae bacterium]